MIEYKQNWHCIFRKLSMLFSIYMLNSWNIFFLHMTFYRSHLFTSICCIIFFLKIIHKKMPHQTWIPNRYWYTIYFLPYGCALHAHLLCVSITVKVTKLCLRPMLTSRVTVTKSLLLGSRSRNHFDPLPPDITANPH